MRHAVPAVQRAWALSSRTGGAGSTLIRYVHIQFTRGLSASVLIRLLRRFDVRRPLPVSLREDILERLNDYILGSSPEELLLWPPLPYSMRKSAEQ
jgi:hypothetical protein